MSNHSTSHTAGEGDLLGLNGQPREESTRSIQSDATSSNFHDEVDVDDLVFADEEAPPAGSQQQDNTTSKEEEVWKYEMPRGYTNTPSATKKATSTSVEKGEEEAPKRKGWMLFRRGTFRTARAEKGATRRVKRNEQRRQLFHTNSLAALTEGDEEDVTQASTHETRQSAGTISSLASWFTSGSSKDELDGGSCWTSRGCQLALLVLLCLLVVLVVIVVVSMATGGMGGFLDFSGMFGGGDNDNDGVAPISNQFQRVQVQNRLKEVLPSSTLTATVDASSPQSRASIWLQNHPLLLQDDDELVPAWRILQLFAMSTFYYAFGGDKWPARQRHQWLSYEVNECQWGDDGVAVIHPKTLSYEYWGRTSCHDNGDAAKRGRLRDLNLNWMVTELVGVVSSGPSSTTTSSRTAAKDEEPQPIGGPVSMPEEITFLTELETLGIDNCGVTADLSALAPTQLASMSQLKRLSFQNNNLQGQLPTSSWPLSLEELNVGQNQITGSIPSELGLLSTSLQELQLFGNQLSGSIPNELEGLQQLTGLSVIANDLTGAIPSSLSQLTKLEYLYLDTNEIEGAVPAGVCQLPLLQAIWVDCSIECGAACGDKCTCPQ